ncbi:histidine kinase dimerization/phosphoacceptor domain -containing protein [Methanosarcina sp. WH1]|uniref:histidine kinase dimerization/phosphoacceptor domain -containing protein n=1 Tax=Methanosarcina sp. WH1 TaxID=1434102 RepID=UPI001E4C13A9|nr:histidine kinase dimerization/phosphoacceptor domain -containing protein [Methanosarcina sp. WH1]
MRYGNIDQKLMDGETLYRMIFDHSIDGIILTDPRDDGKILSANLAVCRMLGWTEEELVGKEHDAILDLQEPSLSALLDELILSGSARAQLTYRRKDGTTFLGEASMVFFMDCNGEPRTVSIIRDITERKQTEKSLYKAYETLEEKIKERTAELEEAYKSLLENKLSLSEAQRIAHIGNWEWNLLTDEVYCSDEIYRILQVHPQAPVSAHNDFLSYIDLDDRDFIYNSIQKALQGEPFSIEYRINLSDGEKRTVHSQGEVVFDEKGSPAQIRGVLQDITERKKAEEALERMDKIRIKEIHHRIKNNLQIISSLLDLQAEKFEDENIIEAFRESQNRVISMSLIHEELYKGEGTDTLDFSAYIQKLVESLFKTYKLSGKNFSLSMDMEEDIFFDMDTAIPLGITVNELVSNSLKHAFTGRDKGNILIKLCKEEISCNTHKSLFSLTISDDGKGLPEDLELKSAESLGLQLVNILVDQLDGKIELKRNNGTQVTIRFMVTENDNLIQSA